jgi:hypothetical protein
MSGYEVLRLLRLSRGPILILSGLGATEHKVRGLVRGADDYPTKPFHKDELIARILPGRIDIQSPHGPNSPRAALFGAGDDLFVPSRRGRGAAARDSRWHGTGAASTAP